MLSQAAASRYAAKLEQTQYRGWKVYRLSNGLISLYVAPEIGGRAIQLTLGHRHYFFVNKYLAGKVLPQSQNNLKAGWANYGGDKVWPAPEGWMNNHQWPSIPYYILDGSPFQSEIVKNTPEEVAVRVTSPPDPRTGVQFVRTFQVFAGTTRVTVREVMRNISERRIRWGIWDVLQNDASDATNPSQPNKQLFVYIPINPRSMFPRGFYNPYGDVRNPSYHAIDHRRMLRVHYRYQVGKVAADSNAGWFAIENAQKDLALVESFRYFPGKKYPDNASVLIVGVHHSDAHAEGIRRQRNGLIQLHHVTRIHGEQRIVGQFLAHRAIENRLKRAGHKHSKSACQGDLVARYPSPQRSANHSGPHRLADRIQRARGRPMECKFVLLSRIQRGKGA